MPRKPRFYTPGIPVHLVQRGLNRNPIFYTDDDYRTYRQWLQIACENHQCQVHAYVLMADHVHLLLTPSSSDGISRMMQSLGSRYVPYVNRNHDRSGALWEGRHKGNVINGDQYLIHCMRYIELNPVRAGVVKSPGDYPWSSFKCNALGHRDELITPHKIFKELNINREMRQHHYRALSKGHVDAVTVRQIREALQSGTPLGDTQFMCMIEQTLMKKVGFKRRGRPRRLQIA